MAPSPTQTSNQLLLLLPLSRTSAVLKRCLHGTCPLHVPVGALRVLSRAALPQINFQHVIQQEQSCRDEHKSLSTSQIPPPSACLPLLLSFCLTHCVRLSFSLAVCVCVCLTVSVSFKVFTSLSLSPVVCLSFSQSLQLSLRQFCLSLSVSVCISCSQSLLLPLL